MSPKEYIEQELNELTLPSKLVQYTEGLSVEEKIKRLLLSKKFRKYSVSQKLMEHIDNAIRLNVKENKPINLTFFNGAYKLWRLEESPYPEWAELFTLMYFIKWLKSICEVYGPGVHLDFFMDDLIVPKLNNIDLDDVKKYIVAFNEIIEFLEIYKPENMKITLTPVGSLFDSEEDFEKSLKKNIALLDEEQGGVAPNIDDATKSMVELNVKVTDEQKQDPKWREKVWNLHAAYMSTKSEPGYHNSPYKIKVFTQPLPSGMTLSVGTTKTSTAKFWVGVGALKKKGEGFIETVLSPQQLEKSFFSIKDIKIEKLNGKNFSSIRILNA